MAVIPVVVDDLAHDDSLAEKHAPSLSSVVHLPTGTPFSYRPSAVKPAEPTVVAFP